MILNYFKIAWRNMMKSKAFSFINIFGLAVGLTCCMLISVYLAYEWNYDSYQEDLSHLYQVETKFAMSGKEFTLAAAAAPFAPAVARDFPEVKESVRVLPLSLFEDKTMLEYKKPGATPVSFYEDKGMMADSNVFRFFTYPFIEGDAGTALRAPSTIVISDEIARKLFGDAPALNKVIHVSSGTNGDVDMKVTGVFRPVDAPSHLQANFFLSFGGGDIEREMKQAENDFATNNMFVTYVRLRQGTAPASVEAKFPAFLDKYAGKDLKAMGFQKTQFLVPVRELHLRTDVPGNITPPASKTSLYILASIAAFTLLIACINFMNLATARSAKRSAEVGIRKVMGAIRGSLIGQFLGESVLMSILAFGLAWGLTALLLPAFGELTARHLSIGLPAHLPMLLGFLGLAVFAGLTAGIYPAFYLSSFQPAKVLKGKFSNSLRAIWMRKGLVVFQFMISVVLIVSTVVINDQMAYLRNQDLGFDKESQIVIPLRGSAGKNLSTAFETEFQRIGQVISSGAAMYYPGLNNPSDNLLYRDGQNPQEAQRVRMDYVDFGYMKTLGLQAVAGRVFSREFPGDTSERIVLNESAVKALGYQSPEAAIGMKIAADWRGNTYKQIVIGVVKDFHFEDLHTVITPYAFRLTGGGSYLVVHARPGAPAPLIASLSAAWHKLDPDEPFEYSFLDDDFQKNYAAEERLQALIRYFTVMAILISCLGLFGLASFSAEQRVREIGIRKVLGASVGSIVTMLTRDFLLLVFIAMVIATPLAWLIMHRWLQAFAYQTPISWFVFLITCVATMAITMATISFHAIRAGLANPVKSLKTE
jgi:putative ABC transport system permease protein